ncbi:MAG: hypothetical protein ACK5MV_03880 [Aminipila sp.]
MSNEELVKLIQNGHSEHIPSLWNQNEAFISLMEYKKLNTFPENLWYLRDDMVNEAYFYFLKAVKGYKANQGGKFLTYLTYHLKSCFNKVIYGGLTERAVKEPLNGAVSLDITLDDEDSITLGETIVDTQAEAYYRNIEHKDFWHEVNQTLQEGINNIQQEKSKELLQVMFDKNTVSLSQAKRIIEASGAPERTRQAYRQNYQKGVRELRRYIQRHLSNKANKYSAVSEYVSWAQSGLRSFRRTGTSSVEWAVLKHECDLKYADMRHCIGGTENMK